jgi:hypothetical protein
MVLEEFSNAFLHPLDFSFVLSYSINLRNNLEFSGRRREAIAELLKEGVIKLIHHSAPRLLQVLHGVSTMLKYGPESLPYGPYFCHSC